MVAVDLSRPQRTRSAYPDMRRSQAPSPAYRIIGFSPHASPAASVNASAPSPASLAYGASAPARHLRGGLGLPSARACAASRALAMNGSLLGVRRAPQTSRLPLCSPLRLRARVALRLVPRPCARSAATPRYYAALICGLYSSRAILCGGFCSPVRLSRGSSPSPPGSASAWAHALPLRVKAGLLPSVRRGPPAGGARGLLPAECAFRRLRSALLGL